MNDEAHDLTVTVGIPVFNGEAYIRAQALAFETRPGPAGAAGQVIASIEGAQKIEFATLLENRATGAIGELIFDFLKPPHVKYPTAVGGIGLRNLRQSTR
jgi:hypothetical protein